MSIESYEEDSTSNSPLSIIDSSEDEDDIPYGDSPLAKVMLSEAKKISPKREAVLARRDALLGAYKKLIEAQRYKPMPVNNFGDWVGGASALKNDLNPNLRAWAASQLGSAENMLREREKQDSSEQNQATTFLKQQAQDLGFFDQDQARADKMLQQADISIRQNEMADLKRVLLELKARKYASGDGSSDTTKAPSALTTDLNDPYAGMDDVGKRQLRMSFEKQLTKMQEDAAPESQNIAQMKRFLELNDKLNLNEKGEEAIAGGTGGISGSIPFRGKFDEDFSELESIRSEIIPKMRQPGSGSSSDLDIKMFSKASVGPTKPYKANKNIGTAYIINRQNAIDKIDFLEQYMAENGHLRGANRLWKKYLNENPIFSPNKQKDYELNENRKTWQQYFGLEESDSSDEDSSPSGTLIESGKEWEQHGFSEDQWKKVPQEMKDKLNKLKPKK